ncbi:centromere-associated protein E-like [Takifugu rubripes]|uniref:centromere-associated protein E-like n=1 Tax=Takifugu rubripes TaxID=31033 RepID=UPI0011455558|nr:centromere-associated protein E-like [Takifugu rubripes]
MKPHRLMLQTHLQTEENQHLHKEMDLQTALEQCQNEVKRLKDLLEDKTKEVNAAVRKRQMRTIAYINIMNELNDAQEALKENRNKCETLEKNLQLQLEENQQLHQRELEENGERLRRELSAETEKLKKELSDREEALKKELCEKENVFLKTHQDLSELWEARAEEWTKRERELEEMLQKMVKQKVEELQLTTGDVEKKKRKIWRVWKWKTWRRLK